MNRESISIQQVGPDRAPEVLDLVNRLLEELGEEGDETGVLNATDLEAAWRENGDRHLAFMAVTENGIPVGITTLSIAFALYSKGDYGIINEMYVVPEHRSRGVGEIMLAAVKKFARDRGWLRIDVTAPESERWIRAREFYDRNGFAYTGPKMKLLLD